MTVSCLIYIERNLNEDENEDLNEDKDENEDKNEDLNEDLNENKNEDIPDNDNKDEIIIIDEKNIVENIENNKKGYSLNPLKWFN